MLKYLVRATVFTTDSHSSNPLLSGCLMFIPAPAHSALACLLLCLAQIGIDWWRHLANRRDVGLCHHYPGAW